MQKSKSQSTTSKKKKTGPKVGVSPGRSVPGTDIKIKKEADNVEPRLHKIPPPKADIEKTLPEPDDEAAKLKYPPPKKDPRFREKWAQYVENVAGRENFKVGHLNTLEILCDLYTEYEDLREFLRKNGRSYQSYGRQGMIWKFFPEVQLLSRVQADIKEYTKMLGLLPKKDHAPESGGEKDDWK